MKTYFIVLYLNHLVFFAGPLPYDLGKCLDKLNNMYTSKHLSINDFMDNSGYLNIPVQISDIVDSRNIWPLLMQGGNATCITSERIKKITGDEEPEINGFFDKRYDMR